MIQTLIYYCAPSRQPAWFSKWTFHLRTLFRSGTPSLVLMATLVSVLGATSHAQEIVGFGLNRFSTLDRLGSYIQVAAGQSHTLALRPDGRAVAWGHNNLGECNVPALPPQVTWVQVAAGGHHSAGLRSDGNVSVWGDITYGQSSVPTLPSGVTFTDVATGGRHVLAVRSDGQIAAWGNNSAGMATVPPLPATVAYVQVSASESNSAALRSDGSIVVWGSTNYGITTVPLLPLGLVYTQVDLGQGNAAALRSDGSIVTWGYISWLNTGVPPLPTGIVYTRVAIGVYEALALRSDGVLVAWGINLNGQLSVPTPPLGITYSGFDLGLNHAAATRTDASVVCWGANDRFQCNMPAAPPGLHYVDVVAGSAHVLALVSDGTIMGVGMNALGETIVPPLPTGTTYVKIDASGVRSAALRSDGAIVAWGQNSFAQNTVPPLPSGVVYTDVSTSPTHLLAKRSDGTIIAWGDYSVGQLNVPPLPTGLTYTKISAGRTSSLATRSDGSAVAWGGMNYANVAVPPIAAGLTFTDISAGAEHSLAKLSDGTTISWGLNTSGQATLPLLPAGIAFNEVDAGYLRSAARRNDGSIVTWGITTQNVVPILPGGYSVAQLHCDEGPTVVLTTAAPSLTGSLLLSAPSAVSQGTTWGLDLSGALPGVPYVIDVSTSGSWPGFQLAPGLSFPLNRPYLNIDLGAPLNALYPGMLQAFTGATTALGTASASFNIPIHPALNGIHLWAAGATLSATGPVGVGAISNSVNATLQPALPALSAVTPNSGPVAGAYTVSITGTNFPAVTAVVIGNAAASNVVRVSSTLITCTAPMGTVGARDVAVYFGTSVLTMGGGFTYTPNLTMLSVTPPNPIPGQLTTVTGTGFSTNLNLSVGGILTPMFYSSPTTFSFNAPTLPACSGVMTLSNTYGQSATMTYGAVPVVVGAFFAAGPVAGGTTFSILGYNFLPGTTVRVGGVLATITSMSTGTPTNSGNITVVSPPSASLGLHAITVTSAAGCTATGTYTFNYY